MLDDVADLYQKLIMERARQPRHANGELAAFDAEAEGDNPMCGDHLHLWLRRDEKGRVSEISHETKGCAICLASADLLGDAVLGKRPEDIATISREFEAMVTDGTGSDGLGDLQALAGVHEYRSRIRCATLPWQALSAALKRIGAQEGEA